MTGPFHLRRQVSARRAPLRISFNRLPLSARYLDARLSAGEPIEARETPKLRTSTIRWLCDQIWPQQPDK
ncbi:MAG: hypothetical protein Q8P67_07695 [archaeon]|nr:hypothetical protein [archaeon]